MKVDITAKRLKLVSNHYDLVSKEVQQIMESVNNDWSKLMKEYAIGITTEGEIQVVNKLTHFEDYIEMLLKMTVAENLLDFGIHMKIKLVKGDFADLIKWFLCKSRTRLFADPKLINYNKTLEGLANVKQMETAKLKDLVKYLAKIMKAV